MSPQEPYVAFCLITSNSPCLYSHPVMSPASLSFILNETSMLTHPKQHIDLSVSSCLFVPFARLIFLPSSPAVTDFVTGWFVMLCSSYLYLLILNKPPYRGGEKELMYSNLTWCGTFRRQGGGICCQSKILKTERWADVEIKQIWVSNLICVWLKCS